MVRDLTSLPQKIVVNDAGVMYIVCQSNTNGIVEISPEEGGTFLDTLVQTMHQ